MEFVDYIDRISVKRIINTCPACEAALPDGVRWTTKSFNNVGDNINTERIREDIDKIPVFEMKSECPNCRTELNISVDVKNKVYSFNEELFDFVDLAFPSVVDGRSSKERVQEIEQEIERNWTAFINNIMCTMSGLEPVQLKILKDSLELERSVYNIHLKSEDLNTKITDDKY